MKNNNVPLVSVVLPTYNRAYYLQQAIRSILAQTFTDWECIVIDDASCDETAETVKSFAKQDSRILYIYQSINRGTAIARNLGVKHSRGTYIAFQDDDDISHPERLERQLENYRKNPDCSFLYTSALKIKTSNYVHWSSSKHPDYKLVHTSLMAPRHILNKIPYRPLFLSMEDHDLKLRLSELSNPDEPGVLDRRVLIDKSLYAYRHIKGLPRTSTDHKANLFQVLSEFSALARRSGIPDFLDNVHTLEDINFNLFYPYLKNINKYPSIKNEIENCIFGLLLSMYRHDPEDLEFDDTHIRLTKHIIDKTAPYFFTQQTFLTRIRFSRAAKSKLCHAIMLGSFSGYQHLLKYTLYHLGRFILLLIAPRVLLECLRRKQFTFILTYLRIFTMQKALAHNHLE